MNPIDNTRSPLRARLLSCPLAWAAAASVAVVLGVGMADPDLVGQLQLAQGFAELVGAVACGFAARHAAGRARLTWILFAVGLGIWCATDFAFGISVAVGWEVPDAITIFDAFWLSFYVPMLTAVGIIYRGLRTERGWQGLLDGALIALATAVLAWVWVLAPLVVESSSRLVMAVDALYPAFDLAAIVSLGWLMVRLGADSPLWLRAVALAFGLQALADLSYIAGSLLGARVEVVSAAAFTAAGWLWAVAARFRTRAPVRTWTASPRSVPPLWSQLVPVACGLALVAVAFTGPGRVVTAAAVGGVFLMVARLIAVLVMDRRLLAERREVSEMRATLLAEERYARQVADEARAAVAQQNERLKELDRMKDEFVAMVSHEFRTPLTAIHNYLYAVLEGEVGALEETQRRFLTVVQRNTDRLARLVEDLLLFAQIHDGRLSLTVDELDVGELLAESVESAGPAARNAGVRLQQGGDPTGLTAGDRVRIGQVVDNLISNAIKFTPHGGQVHVDLHASGDAIVIEVADTGPGIAPDEIGQLFTPFYRTRHATENVVPGTGLGLTISKAIVESHGGAISVRSREPRGTAFRVVLPIATTVAEETAVEPIGALR